MEKPCLKTIINKIVNLKTLAVKRKIVYFFGDRTEGLPDILSDEELKFLAKTSSKCLKETVNSMPALLKTIEDFAEKKKQRAINDTINRIVIQARYLSGNTVRAKNRIAVEKKQKELAANNSQSKNKQTEKLMKSFTKEQKDLFISIMKDQ